jgi:TRAP-type mannitol/chloroaromatic compound transport system permease small subunit
MDNVTFGVTMLVVGMGGTLLTLWGISLVIRVLKKIFPAKEDEKTD